jgi:hypothetical protein
MGGVTLFILKQARKLGLFLFKHILNIHLKKKLTIFTKKAP